MRLRSEQRLRNGVRTLKRFLPVKLAATLRHCDAKRDRVMAVDLDRLTKYLDCMFAARKLFHEIEKELGPAEAQHIFAKICTPQTAALLADIKNDELLEFYASMGP